MVHGVTDIGLSWTPLTWELQESYDIYMLDTCGNGLSDPFTPGDDGDTLVKDVVEFVRAMDFERPILMGHSMGAYWALSKKQYHGPYTTEAWQAMSGTMATRESLAEIPGPALVLKADASPEVRESNEEAARVMQTGRLVHIDEAGHNLHHELERTVEMLTEFLSSL